MCRIRIRKTGMLKALECFNKALFVWEKLFGAEHPMTKSAREKIDKVKQKMQEKSNVDNDN